MKDFIDVRCDSGDVLRFHRVGAGRMLSPMGGNYLYVRETGEGHEVLFAGEGRSLMTDARDRWDEARGLGAHHLYTRLNISESVRQHELAEVIAAIRPTMNAPAEPEASPEPPDAEPDGPPSADP
jgi:hypothetical protein